MIKVFIGENSGFCFGVKRAIDKIVELTDKKEKVYSLGYVIHNPQAIEKIKQKGAEIIENPEDILKLSNQNSQPKNGITPIDGKVVIRTHGVKKEITETLKKNKVDFFDATCPFVTRSQRIVEKLSDQGYGIVIFGNPEHPEIVGVVSYAKTKNVFVVQKPEDVELIPPMKKIAVVSQTTQKLDDYIEIVKKLIEKGFEIRVFNTVCEVTVDAQKEAYEIAKMSDIVIVIGGKMSSNTDKLYKVCKNITSAYKIETADEIDPSWLKGKKNIGIVAGTSTPDWIIKDTIKKIEEITGEKVKIQRVGKKNKFSAESFEWE